METVLARAHAANPRNAGALEGATAVGREGIRGEGPYFYLYLRVEDGVIAAASFESNGCMTSLTTGSILTTVLTGRTVTEAGCITEGDLMALLGSVPPGREGVLTRAAHALRMALK